jgi:LPXTG-motif cell wall-anchored protein
MDNIKFYIVIIILISILLSLFLLYKRRKKNKIKNIIKKETNIQQDKIKSDLKQLREKLSKSNDPITKNEIINKINLIINNFKK